MAAKSASNIYPDIQGIFARERVVKKEAFKEAKTYAQEQNIPFPYNDFEELKKGDLDAARAAWCLASVDYGEMQEKWMDSFEQDLKKDAENTKWKQSKKEAREKRWNWGKEYLRLLVERKGRKGRKMRYVVVCLVDVCTSKY